MTAHGWNAQELARQAGTSPKTINRFLDGSVQTTKTAKKIATAMGYAVKRYLARVEVAA